MNEKPNTEDIIKSYNEWPKERFLNLIKNENASSILENYLMSFFFKKYLNESKKVLDAGGGWGKFSATLRSMGKEVYLVDASEKQLNFAKLYLHGRLNFPDIKITNGRLESLDFGEAFFDGIICLGETICYTDFRKTLSEFSRVIKENGIIILTVENRESLAKKVIEEEMDIEKAKKIIEEGVAPYPKSEDESWNVKSFFPEELEEEITNSGFKIIETFSLPFFTLSLKGNEINKNISQEKMMELLKFELRQRNRRSIIGASPVLGLVARKGSSGNPE